MGQPTGTDTANQALARRIALELALPIVEELLEPLADLIVARLATRLEAGASCGRNESTDTPTRAEDGSVGLRALDARLVDAEVVASALGVSRECVYTHAEELGWPPHRQRSSRATPVRPRPSPRGVDLSLR